MVNTVYNKMSISAVQNKQNTKHTNKTQVTSFQGIFEYILGCGGNSS